MRNGFCGGKRGEEYALCLVSNRFEAEFAAPSPEQQEQYLAEQLVGLMSAYAAKNGAAPEDFSPQAFLISVALPHLKGAALTQNVLPPRVLYVAGRLVAFPGGGSAARRV